MKVLFCLSLLFVCLSAVEAQITDIDDNVYQTVTIGSQTWMAENLKTTKFNDGTSIPLENDSVIWNKITTPGFCWYNNDPERYKNTYGALYNWYAVQTGKICPSGYHVPSLAEWTELILFLGGESKAGGKLKEADTVHWLTPNFEATDETGFSALPAGFRYYKGLYYFLGRYGNWWSSSEYSKNYGWAIYMAHNSRNVNSDRDKKQRGFSVRCIRD